VHKEEWRFFTLLIAVCVCVCVCVCVKCNYRLFRELPAQLLD